MTLEEILDEWTVDCRIDQTKMSSESATRCELHSKYIKYLVQEKKILLSLSKTYKLLRHDKKEFLMNPTKELLDKGWQLPPQGRIAKSEVERYLEGDRELIDLELKIAIQEEKESVLKSIINEIKARGYDIKNALEWRRFMEGER